jgi:DNA-binding NarL/FixJ family response regulator
MMLCWSGLNLSRLTISISSLRAGTDMMAFLAPASMWANSSQPSRMSSRREREVAVLIARGHTNREMATELVISEWTVDTHVRHILTKLNFRSRALVAAWALKQGWLSLTRAEYSARLQARSHK